MNYFHTTRKKVYKFGPLGLGAALSKWSMLICQWPISALWGTVVEVQPIFPLSLPSLASFAWQTISHALLEAFCPTDFS